MPSVLSASRSQIQRLQRTSTWAWAGPSSCVRSLTNWSGNRRTPSEPALAAPADRGPQTASPHAFYRASGSVPAAPVPPAPLAHRDAHPAPEAARPGARRGARRRAGRAHRERPTPAHHAEAWRAWSWNRWRIGTSSGVRGAARSGATADPGRDHPAGREPPAAPPCPALHPVRHGVGATATATRRVHPASLSVRAPAAWPLPAWGACPGAGPRHDFPGHHGHRPRHGHWGHPDHPAPPGRSAHEPSGPLGHPVRLVSRVPTGAAQRQRQEHRLHQLLPWQKHLEQWAEAPTAWVGRDATSSGHGTRRECSERTRPSMP